jgi:hypothetical protein
VKKEGARRHHPEEQPSTGREAPNTHPSSLSGRVAVIAASGLFRPVEAVWTPCRRGGGCRG